VTREVFITQVEREQDALRGFLLTLCCGDKSNADDLAQDALVKAYVSSAGYQEKGRFRSWLFRIAYNCYVDYSRKKHPELVPIEGKDTLNLPAEETSDAAFRFQQINQALERLPEKEKAVIILFYFEDRSIKETASILGIPSGTVKYHLSMGRAHLKELISL
jgi:RNA polymerase sigma-70 factor (ECF subfamily)